ncbi:hypothetical protein J4409_02025 [Candidatus Woesearchaeota archaeon]|nr:hypothetical protein [Candidatus Woesearchaeota archaeon]
MDLLQNYSKEGLNKSNNFFNTKRECDNLLYPFRHMASQKVTSIIAMIIGVLLMITTPIFRLGTNLTISGFVVGVIVALIGFLYFLDVK